MFYSTVSTATEDKQAVKEKLQILTLDFDCTKVWVFRIVCNTNNIKLIYFEEFKLLARKNSH